MMSDFFHDEAIPAAPGADALSSAIGGATESVPWNLMDTAGIDSSPTQRSPQYPRRFLHQCQSPLPNSI